MSCCPYASSALLEPFRLEWYVGDTAAVQATLRRSDGTPYPLRLAQPRLIVAESDEPGAALLWDLTLADGAILLDVTGGVVVFSPGPQRSSLLAPARTYPARIALTTAAGEIMSLRPGYLITYPAVPMVAA